MIFQPARRPNELEFGLHSAANCGYKFSICLGMKRAEISRYLVRRAHPNRVVETYGWSMKKRRATSEMSARRSRQKSEAFRAGNRAGQLFALLYKPERELEGLSVRTLGLSRPGAGNVGGERRDPDKCDQRGHAYLCELLPMQIPSQ